MGEDLERNKAVVREHFHALDSGEYSSLSRLHDPAGRNHAPGPFDLSDWPEEGKPFGPEDVQATFEWLRGGAPDPHVSIDVLVAEDDLVDAWIRVIGTQTSAVGPTPPTGRRTDFRHVHRFRLRDGKIVEHWAVRDDLRAMIQAGAVEPLGRRPPADPWPASR